MLRGRAADRPAAGQEQRPAGAWGAVGQAQQPGQQVRGPGLPRSKFANPFKRATREDAVSAYKEWIAGQPALIAAARSELAGRDLACWCPPGQPCHADVLLELASTPGVPAGGDGKP